MGIYKEYPREFAPTALAGEESEIPRASSLVIVTDCLIAWLEIVTGSATWGSLGKLTRVSTMMWRKDKRDKKA